MKTQIVIVDDHELMAKALSSLVQKFDQYEVIYEVASGLELIRRFDLGMVPQIVLLDVHMPEMDGYEVAKWLRDNYPTVRVLALSMNDKEEAIVKMLRNGASGYLLKGCKPREFKAALDSITSKGFYYSEYITSHLIKNLNPTKGADPVKGFGLNERELTFIRMACSDLTYNEIADKMCVSPRTVDGYRESVFQKMDVKSRVGMVIKAMKNNLLSPE
ncbi:response regulator transcription factor [Dyadobacter sp. BHUBP1]|uniref:response regulator transcription factor n=1 Tax=Dyadobacter sp. BHUBP1 TaxID=3424178 RepID=UPI003D3259A1